MKQYSPGKSTAADNMARKAVTALVDSATPEQQQALLRWAQDMAAIRQSNLPKVVQLRKALSVTKQTQNEVIWPLLKAWSGEWSASAKKKTLWETEVGQ